MNESPIELISRNGIQKPRILFAAINIIQMSAITRMSTIWSNKTTHNDISFVRDTPGSGSKQRKKKFWNKIRNVDTQDQEAQKRHSEAAATTAATEEE